MSYGVALYIVFGSAYGVVMIILMAQTPALTLRRGNGAETHLMKLIEIFDVVGH